MTRFDFSPLYRSTVGFDRVFNLIDQATRGDDASTGYPPYNIEKLDDDNYRVTLAVAGFGEDELTVEAQEGRLTVTGKLNGGNAGNGGRTFLHRGIGGREFRRVFQLADHVKVVGAELHNGLLHVALHRELPEAVKPRQVKISSGPGGLLRKANAGA